MTSVSALLLSTGQAALATDLPADIEECNSDITPQGPYASCPGFNVSFGKHTYYSNEETVSSFDEYQTEDGVPVTTRRVAVGDYVVWKSDDKEGTKLCFPKAKGIWTETRYPDGTTSSTVEGSSLFLMNESDMVAEGITGITKPGTFYQVEGTRTVIIAADGIHGAITDLDGTFIDVCELLSSSASETGGPPENEKPQPRTPPPLFGALNAAAIQSESEELPKCSTIGITDQPGCRQHCTDNNLGNVSFNYDMTHWTCGCFKDGGETKNICTIAASFTAAPTSAGGPTPTPPSPTPPSPTPPSPTPPTPTASCDSMGITNSDQCAKGCSSRNAGNTHISSWIQENGDSLCKCGGDLDFDQYVLCENNTTSGGTVLSGLITAALLASGSAMMILV